LEGFLRFTIGQDRKLRKSQGDWRIEGLGATGPHRELEEKLALFGQFVGDWDIVEARYPQPDGTEVKRKGEVHFGWILDGRAVQDVWMTVDDDANRAVHGTTVRFYDPKIDAWHSIWISPVKGLVQTFIARKVKDEIVLEGKTPDGDPEKWIFSHITPNSFRWRSEETHDHGRTWVLTEEMQIRKQRKT
jgi:hypothetical protein